MSKTQPRRISRAAVLGMTGVLGTGLIFALMIGPDPDPRGMLRGLLLAVLPVPGYVSLALWIDRFEAEPPWMLTLAFFWGATLAVFLSLLLNTLVGAVAEPILGPGPAEAVVLVLSSPVVEELSKAAALFLLCFWRADEFDNITDGIVYAAMVGLGFAMTENVQYYGTHPDVASLFFLRGVLSPFAHPLFSSMVGIGLGAMRQRSHPRAGVAPLLGLGGAILAHSLWNAASLGGRFLPVYVGVMVPLFLGVLGMVRASLRVEARILRAYLRAELRAGRLDRAEYDELCSVRGRQRAVLRAWRSGGWWAWRQRRSRHRLWSELAFHRWRRRRGLAPRPREGELYHRLNSGGAT